MRKTLRLLLAARDPARARLTAAAAVSLGVLASALLTNLLIGQLHAERSLLSVGIFLSIMAGASVKDRSPRERLVTTMLLIPASVAVIALAALLAPNRILAIGAFILVSGAAVWVRRYGARAGSLGTVTFMGYFFALLLKPTHDQLPALCLIALLACTTQLVARATLLLQRPRRQLLLLLRELRAASESALDAASRPGHPGTLRLRLARIDATSESIDAWQRNSDAELHADGDPKTLGDRVLDARVDIQELCYLLARLSASAADLPARLHRDLAHLRTVLDERAPACDISSATEWATDIIAHRPSQRGTRLGATFASYLIARSVHAHARLRELTIVGAPPDPKPSPGSGSGSARPRVSLAPKQDPWTRMTVQAMAAASIASIVGEAISASHWYWAVITASLIFTGTTTRGGILTRAFRRILGTAIGIIVGIAAVALASGNVNVLSAICVLGVFGALYFGPLNSLYSALFTTTILVALYRLLGKLGADVLETRLEETIAGGVIGVLCAYLILSSSSKPALEAKVNAYLDALEALLGRLLATPVNPVTTTALRTGLRTLELAQGDVDTAVSGMSTAFLVTGPRRTGNAVHLMYIATRSAARLVQLDGDLARPDPLVAAAISRVAARASAARHALAEARGQPAIDRDADDHQSVNALLQDQASSFDPRSPSGEALIALLRMDWTLAQVIDDSTAELPLERGGRKRKPALKVSVPPV
ncbi:MULTISPECIES: FUSC family protein [unclassified Pseudoclavibacter]|uniref:FUSC family protein n=1 Tax=unclassified Pseudoclavibacter TaxID=2615177 RepID=UPI000CE7705F|nr:MULTISPECIES: FUSC family protein [unclassified Pseudoclavibacter]PPF74026.1 hypothetical protein C5B99_15100 [Pseudoclavibacter sp. Z016]PPG01580.1 hypothetical protein C5E06_16650 [Pseudoclavibacter sp. RFBI5]